MRAVVRASMALVALAAAALSFTSLMRLGQLAGYGSLAPLYPVVVDAGAAASCAAWLHTRGRQALGMTWALLTISVVLNGTTHYLQAAGTVPSWLLVVAVAAVPPTVLGLCVHLAVGLGGHTDPPVEAVAGPVEPVRHEETPRVDPVAELIAAGVGRRRLAKELDISEHEARQLLAGRTNGVAR